MSDTEHVVRAKLVAEDGGADEKLRKLKEGFEGADAAAKKAKSGAGDFLKSVAAQALAFNAAGIASRIHGTAMGFVDAAAGAEAARRSMAATAVVLEGVPWEEATEHAKAAQAEMTKLGLASGFSSGEVHEAFTSMLEASDGSQAAIAQVKGELGSVAKIADAFGMSLEAAGREVSFMHEGTLRTRGQLFQLLRSTGIFGSDVHKAAEGWAKMTDAERAKAIGFGLDQVAKKIENLPPSYQRLVGQVKAVFAGIEKDLGAPIVEALVPALKAIEPKLAQMRTELRQIAQAIGPEIGKWIREGAELAEAGLAYVVAHAQEIRDAIRGGFEYAKTVFDWMLAHKEELAGAFVLNKASGLVGPGLDLASKLGAAGGAVGGAANAASAAGAVARSVAGLGALALAATAAAAALYAIDRTYQERKQTGKAQEDVKGQIEQFAAQGDVKGVRRMIDSMREMDAATGEAADDTSAALWLLSPPIAALKLGIQELDPTVQTSLGMTKDAFDQWGDDVVIQAQMAAADAEHYQQLAASGMMDIQSGNLTGITKITDAYNSAIATNNDAAAHYAADLLVASGFTAQALEESGIKLEGGLDALAEHVSKGAAFADLLKKFVGEGGAGGLSKPPQINMSGGQTFHIKQDFRDQDPDRIALVFRRDLSNVVSRRLSARTSSPWGT